MLGDLLCVSTARQVLQAFLDGYNIPLVAVMAVEAIPKMVHLERQPVERCLDVLVHEPILFYVAFVTTLRLLLAAFRLRGDALQVRFLAAVWTTILAIPYTAVTVHQQRWNLPASEISCLIFSMKKSPEMLYALFDSVILSLMRRANICSQIVSSALINSTS